MIFITNGVILSSILELGNSSWCAALLRDSHEFTFELQFILLYLNAFFVIANFIGITYYYLLLLFRQQI